MTTQNAIIYTDGSCPSATRGKGGYGAHVFLIRHDGSMQHYSLSQGYTDTTNNRMEIMGAIKALESLDQVSKVELYSDSKYMVDAITNGWVANWKMHRWKTNHSGKVKNPDLWMVLDHLLKVHDVTFHWTKAHTGDYWNEQCDQLAVRAARSKPRNLLPDTGVRKIHPTVSDTGKITLYRTDDNNKKHKEEMRNATKEYTDINHTTETTGDSIATAEAS